MKLTEHFRLGEFTRSASAKAHDIDNSVPDVETAMRLAALCVCILEPLVISNFAPPNFRKVKPPEIGKVKPPNVKNVKLGTRKCIIKGKNSLPL